jgi:hypothetical protein
MGSLSSTAPERQGSITVASGSGALVARRRRAPEEAAVSASPHDAGALAVLGAAAIA